jgi:hypothetical protein
MENFDQDGVQDEPSERPESLFMYTVYLYGAEDAQTTFVNAL